MGRSSVLQLSVVSLMLAMVTSLPTGPLQQKYPAGTTTWRNDDILKWVKEQSKTKTAIQIMCELPATLQGSTAGGSNLQYNDEGCTLIKAHSMANLYCGASSSLYVANTRDVDLCNPVPDQPTAEFMEELCDGAMFHSQMYVKGGVEVSYSCGKIKGQDSMLPSHGSVPKVDGAQAIIIPAKEFL